MTCVPKSNLAEWHLTYRCDLACAGCNRACFLPPATPDMTLDDAHEFVRQAKELCWAPDVALLGGEPTLHADLLRFLEIARELSGRIIVVSNGFSRHAKERLEQIRTEGLAEVSNSFKPHGSIRHAIADVFTAPVDFGMEGRDPCTWHSRAEHCGISVDAAGYTACPIVGAIDGILGLGVRTRRLADLWVPEKVESQTAALCQFCGKGLGLDRAHPAECRTVRGTSLSATWQRAAERLLKESLP